MLPIAIASIMALTVFLERMYSVREAKLIPETFLLEFYELLQQNRYLDAIARGKSSQCSIGNILVVAVENRSLTREQLKSRIEEVGKQEIASLDKYIIVLGVIASVAPLMGLLGTVWGMIDAFRAIEALGEPNVSHLAEGIYKALVTTLAGLAVGIPALVAHRWVLRKIDVIATRFERESLQVLNLLHNESE